LCTISDVQQQQETPTTKNVDEKVSRTSCKTKTYWYIYKISLQCLIHPQWFCTCHYL